MNSKHLHHILNFYIMRWTNHFITSSSKYTKPRLRVKSRYQSLSPTTKHYQMQSAKETAPDGKRRTNSNEDMCVFDLIMWSEVKWRRQSHNTQEICQIHAFKCFKHHPFKRHWLHFPSNSNSSSFSCQWPTAPTNRINVSRSFGDSIFRVSQLNG